MIRRIAEQLSPGDASRSALYALAGANLIPLVGVLLLGWRVGDIMVLFWLENVIIGLYNIVRMLIASGGGILNTIMKIPVIAFFTIHYGGFAAVHGMFVVLMFVGLQQGFSHSEAPTATPPETIVDSPDARPLPAEPSMSDADFDDDLAEIMNTLWEMIIHSGLWVGILALVVSHGVSLYSNFIKNGEFRNVSADDLMTRPYGRVILLHFVIIFGGILVVVTGQLTAALALLVVLKTLLDAGAHLRERRTLGSPQAGATR